VAELINRGFAALPLNGPAFAETASTSRPTIANTASALNAQRPAFPSSSPSPIVSAPLIVEPKNNASARTIEEPAITITVPPVKK
jgi:hypothetical protein